MARSSTTRSLCTNKRTFFCASATPGFDRAPRGESARAEKRDVARESRSGPVLAPRGQVFFLSPPDNRYAQGSKCCLGPSTTTACTKLPSLKSMELRRESFFSIFHHQNPSGLIRAELPNPAQRGFNLPAKIWIYLTKNPSPWSSCPSSKRSKQTN